MEVLTIGIVGLASLAAALAMVGAGLHAAHLRRDAGSGLLPYLFFPVLIAMGTGALLSGRNLNLPPEMYAFGDAKPALLVWIHRFVSVFIVAALADQVARLLLQGTWRNVPKPLLLAFGIFFLTQVIMPGFLGKHASFSHEYLYAGFLCAGALLCNPSEGDRAIRSARTALFVFLLAGAVVLPLQPDMVLARGYRGLIPLLDFRYAGLSSHANSLGMLAALFVLCLWSRPYDRRWLNLPAWSVGLGSLLLAQSKTNWVACAAGMACLAYYRHGDAVRLFFRRNPGAIAGLLLAVMGLAGMLALLVMFRGDRLAAFFDTSAGADLLSLTGRDLIWEVAVQEWRDSPLFGYGLSIWDDQHRQRIGMAYAFNAHSQFYQSLSSSGTVGVVGLAIYAIALPAFSLKAGRASRGLAPALCLLILFVSISEVPLSLIGYGQDLLLHSLLLMVIAASHAAREPTTFRGGRTPSLAGVQ